MGKLEAFEVEFNENKVVYTPGESISGKVTVKLNQPIQCKVIKVSCNGFCGITSKINDTAWTTEEQYFNNTISVADKGTLKQGDHQFPFKFLIPASSPTSFEGSYGKIIYRVRAFIETPRFAKDYSTEKPFYLLSLLNLNELPDIWGPSTSEVTQQFTYMLLKTGTIVLKAETDMKGYTPGQIIKVSAYIHNQSSKSTGHIAASLMQRVTYETKKPTHDLKSIVEAEGGEVKGGREVKWEEQIIVPALPQSSLNGCELIKIEYYVKVSLKSPDVSLTLPIHIGNVSLDKKRSHSKKEVPPSKKELVAPESEAEPSASSSMNTTPARPGPRPAPRPTPRSRMSSHSSPSAPPAEYHHGAEGGNLLKDDFPNKRQSQAVSPNAFSYAPGLFFPQNQPPNASTPAPSGPSPLGGSTGATAPYPSGNGAHPVAAPLSYPLPDYGTQAYPQEAPPSYSESCNT
ncbi:PREDICTED: arrestin domain-containing protein 1-like [Poecilia mexicana]|uniref:Arrestin C-terminal-like domain-containing protein n=1 Tax=Poecilia mexicana TaxID=48701 RepID=A0A3B3WUC6_9TELE|nr:PREDICTED: arrestin domain-containing protein 1-like [Poecilia mexicana]